MLEQVVIFGRRHLVRVIRCYLSYYHGDGCHLGLSKGHATRTPRYVATITNSESCGTAPGRRITPSLHMARDCLRQFSSLDTLQTENDEDSSQIVAG